MNHKPCQEVFVGRAVTILNLISRFGTVNRNCDDGVTYVKETKMELGGHKQIALCLSHL